MKYYVIRVEFQFWDYPYIHSFLLVLNLPKLSNEIINGYCKFLNSTLSVIVPLEEHNPWFFKSVNNYQTHPNSKTCRKYKDKACWFHYGYVFAGRTIVGRPITYVIKQVFICFKNEILLRGIEQNVWLFKP